MSLPAFILFASGDLRAEVATDGTLGRAVRLTGGRIEVGAELGRVRGRNLFHSFRRFGVERGGEVRFTGPSGLDNVISRVTGGEPSRIDGRLASSIDGADVWLVNPSGILFGPDAQLDVRGSFHASTADELRLEDGTAFSARDLGGGGVLSVAAPESFGFLGGRPAGIEVDQSSLVVPAGRSLSLVGGDVDIVSGPEGFVRAEAGKVLIGAVGDAGSVRIVDGATDGTLASIRLSDQANLDASGNGGGSVLVRGGSLVVEGASGILAVNIGPMDARNGIDLRVGNLMVGAASLITSETLASGGAGALVVRASDVTVRDGGQLRADSFASGAGGSVTIDADRLELRNGGLISSSPVASGDGGRVGVRAERLLVDGEGMITEITGSAAFSPDTDAFGSGDAGAVTVTAGDLELRDGGAITSISFAEGDAGAVDVRAGRLFVSGDGADAFTGITSQADLGSRGIGGDVTVTADVVELRDRGSITGSTFGRDRAGTVTVRAGRLLISGDGAETFTGISSRAQPGSAGDGGAVTVTVDGILELWEQGSISSSTFGSGDAGPVSVRAERLRVVGNGLDDRTTISSETIENASGNGGSVTVRTNLLELRDRGLITSDSADVGPAGDVTVRAGGLTIEDGGRIGSSNTGDGPAGNVTVRADRIDVDGGDIWTEGNNAQGGRIEVRADGSIHLVGADVSSNGIVPQANRSLVTLEAPSIVLNGSRVTSLTGTGAPLPGSGEASLLGEVTVISADSLVAASSSVVTTGVQTDIGSGLQVSAGAFLDAEGLMGENCAARRAGRASSFTRAGRGGLPPAPDRPLASPRGGDRGARQALRAGLLLQLDERCDGSAGG